MSMQDRIQKKMIPMPSRLTDDQAPWRSEPDRLDWAAHGFQCAIRRVDGIGHLSGYVVVTKGHPWYGVDFLNLNDDQYAIDIHGGLTFGSMVSDLPLYKLQGVDSDDYVIGFDCAHHGDVTPFTAERFGYRGTSETYKTIEWVKSETERLALQARSALLKALSNTQRIDK